MLLYFQYSVFLFINQRRMKQQTDKRFWIPIQYIGILFTTVCLIGLNVHFIFIFVIALLFWLFMPAVIIACISFFYSLRCNTKHKKRLLILHIINILLVSFLYFNPANRCDADIMEKHYTKYGNHMEQIYRNLYDELTPGCYVDIEFEHGHVSIFHFSNGIDKMESNWDPSEEKVDSLLHQCGLGRSSLKWLEIELKEISCVSISMRADPDESFCVGFRRIGMGKYYYQIYHKPLSLDEQREINESDASILYTPYVVFNYAGGAIGNQNFIGKQEYMRKKEKQ